MSGGDGGMWMYGHASCRGVGVSEGREGEGDENRGSVKLPGRPYDGRCFVFHSPGGWAVASSYIGGLSSYMGSSGLCIRGTDGPADAAAAAYAGSICEGWGVGNGEYGDCRWLPSAAYCWCAPRLP